MKRCLKSICITILFTVSLHFTAQGQKPFIDSIRNMLEDLNNQIQHSPINHFIYHITPFCKGDSMNDSLEAGLKELFSENYLYHAMLLQPVSQHLLTKYSQFNLHIATYITERSRGEDSIKNMLWLYAMQMRPEYQNAATNILPFQLIKEKIKGLSFTDSFQLAKAKYYFADCFVGLLQHDSAICAREASLKINPNKTLEEREVYTRTLYYLGNDFWMNKNIDSACIIFKQLLFFTKESFGEGSEEYAFWLLHAADKYVYMQKYTDAMQMCTQALGIARQTTGIYSNLYAVICNEIGDIYLKTGLYAPARPWMQQALDIKQRIFGKTYFDNVVTLHGLASVYKYAGLYDEALQLLQQSLAITKYYFGEQSQVYAYDLHAIAEVYALAGQYEKVLPLYQKALAIHGVNKSGFYYPKTLHSLACFYVQLGQYDKAMLLFDSALHLKKEFSGETTTDYILTLNSYAQASVAKGDYTKALQLQLQAIALNKKILLENKMTDSSINAFIATGYYNLASIYLETNNLQKAEQACNTALSMRKEMFDESQPDIAASYDLLGEIKNETGQYNEALINYNHGYEIRKTLLPATHPDFIQSLCHLGLALVQKGNIDEGLALLMQADSAALLHIQESYSFLSEDEKLAYLHTAEKQFEYLPSLLYLQKIKSQQSINCVFNNAIALKSMVLFQQRQVYKNIRSSNDSNTISLYNDWRFNKSLTGKQLLLPVQQRIKNFDSLQEITVQMEEQLSQVSASFRNNNLHIENGVQQVSAQLGANAAAIEFISFRLYDNGYTDTVIYAALVVLPHSNFANFVPLCSEKDLAAALKYLNNSGEAAITYMYPNTTVGTPLSKRIYQLVWEPLEPFLKNIKDIFFAPCGLLCGISFSALHPQKNIFLGDEFQLHQLLSARSIIFNDTIKNNFTNISFWGDIDYNAENKNNGNIIYDYEGDNAYLFSPADNKTENKTNNNRTYWPLLPGTKKEIDKIETLFASANIASVTTTGGNANEEAFKKMDAASPGLLHFATHGFFIPAPSSKKIYAAAHEPGNLFSIQQNPLFRCGLLLAGANHSWTGNATPDNVEDGILTAYEIGQLDLSKTSLVTLSTCQSGLGDIDNTEGIFGLQRAFKLAGAQEVLTSLWNVPDETTTLFMQIFYTKLIQQKDAYTALQFAQKEIGKKYSPYYWAGFVLVK